MEQAVETHRLRSVGAIPGNATVVRTLGTGAHGSAILCQAPDKPQFVVKVLVLQNFNPCLSEYEMQLAFQELKIAPEAFNVHSASRSITMQYVPFILNKAVERSGDILLPALRSVIKTIRTYTEAGYTHGDLHLANIGSLQNNFSDILLLDFGRTSRSAQRGDARVDIGMLMLSCRAKFPDKEVQVREYLQKQLHRLCYASSGNDVYTDYYFNGDSTKKIDLSSDKSIISLMHMYANAFKIIL